MVTNLVLGWGISNEGVPRSLTPWQLPDSVRTPNQAMRPALLPSSLPFFRTVRPLHDLPTFFSGPRVRPLHDLPTFFRPGQEHPKPAKVACWLRAQRLAEKRRKWGRLKRESCQIVLILHVLRLRDPPTLRSNPAMVSERLRWTSLGSEMPMRAAVTTVT